MNTSDRWGCLIGLLIVLLSTAVTLAGWTMLALSLTGRMGS